MASTELRIIMHIGQVRHRKRTQLGMSRQLAFSGWCAMTLKAPQSHEERDASEYQASNIAEILSVRLKSPGNVQPRVYLTIFFEQRHGNQRNPLHLTPHAYDN